MPREKPPVNSEVLRWALDESGLSAEEAASRVGVSADTLSAWLRGDDLPTRSEFKRFAALLKRPASVFFLAEPPAAVAIPPQLRRATGRTERRLRCTRA